MLVKGIKVFLKKKKTKNKNMVASDIKILMTKKKIKKHQCKRECYKNLSKEQKKILVEYKRNYYIMPKPKA